MKQLVAQQEALAEEEEAAHGTAGRLTGRRRSTSREKEKSVCLVPGAQYFLKNSEKIFFNFSH